MKQFLRKNNSTKKPFYLIGLLLFLMFGVWSFTTLEWYENVFLLPLSLVFAYIFYRNFKKENLMVTSVVFENETVELTFLNGEKEQFAKNEFGYALLVKKFYKPVRQIEFLRVKKGKLWGTSSKTITRFKVNKWDNLEEIAKYLIVNDFARQKWKFGFGFGEMLMVFSILLGAMETVTESYIGSVDAPSHRDLSAEMGDVGGDIDDIEKDNRSKYKTNEEKFVEKHKLK